MKERQVMSRYLKYWYRSLSQGCLAWVWWTADSTITIPLGSNQNRYGQKTTQICVYQIMGYNDCVVVVNRSIPSFSCPFCFLSIHKLDTTSLSHHCYTSILGSVALDLRFIFYTILATQNPSPLLLLCWIKADGRLQYS